MYFRSQMSVAALHCGSSGLLFSLPSPSYIWTECFYGPIIKDNAFGI